MDIGEFIDTYSDDLITIREARAAAYTHPLRGDYAFAEWLDASFCRLLVVFVVGGIEAMLESWRGRDRFNILETYFAQNVTNGERVTSLYQAFSDAGFPVDRQVFDDYLAIKYLRNTITHGRWKKHEKEWLDARGFPTDTRKLTKEHLDKVEHVSQNMMLYIALTGLADPNAAKPAKLIKLDETITRLKDEPGILRVRDIERIIWNNLERINDYIYADIEKTVTTERYNWAKGRSQAELESLSDEERKRLFYIAARRAGEEDYEPLTRHRTLAMEALQFWQEYWQRAVLSRGLDEDSVQHALQVFHSPHFDPQNAGWSIIANVVQEDAAYQLADRILAGAGPLTGKQVVRALRAGKLAYELVPNITPVTLFTVRLPIVDPKNAVTYHQEAERAFNVFLLNRAWYECVEYRRRFTDDSLGFYIRMCREFAQRPSGG